MKTKHLLIAAITASLALSMSACAPTTPTDGGDDDVLTIGFITKFPVDFYDIMVDAAVVARCAGCTRGHRQGE